MKKIILLFIIIITATASQAQVTEALAIAKFIPTFQFGIKGGFNLTSLSTSGTLNSDNQAGYLAGFYAKIGKIIQFQPEIYIAGKNVKLTDDNGESNTVKFTSIDVPLLITKNFAGALGFGAHVSAGPVISFVVDKNQSLSGAYDKITKFDYNNQDVALQFGGGVDVQGLTIDLRYELGLDKLSKDDYPDTRINMFNLSLGFRVY
jgi:hypothetical protein